MASYPRSGSALTALILWQCFHVRRVVVGAPRNPSDKLPEPDESRDVIRYFGGVGTFYPSADAIPPPGPEEPPLAIKTHDAPPEDGRPCLIILRDGRAAISSFRRFMRDNNGVDVSFADLITMPRFNWSARIARFLDRRVPSLVLRFEDLIAADINAQIDRIGAFLDVARRGELTATLDDMRRFRPQLVNSGQNDDGIADVESTAGDLF
jgi:hypothetical protein